MEKIKKIYFGSIKKNINTIPDLIEIQVNSFESYLQSKVEPENRPLEGFQSVFKSVFPITSPDGNIIIDFIEYYVGEAKYSERDAKLMGKTFSVPIKAKFRLIFKTTGEVREQDIFICDLPLMTTRGTFIINGAERVVVNQIHRSPGVFFGYDSLHNLFSSKIIPDKGAWVEFEIDNKGFIIVRIDRKRKIYLGTFFKSIGLGTLGIYKIHEHGRHDLLLKMTKEEANKIPITGKLIFVKSEAKLSESENNSFYVVEKEVSESSDGNKAEVKLKLGLTPYEVAGSISKTLPDYEEYKYISFVKTTELTEGEKVSEKKTFLYNLSQVILQIFYKVQKIEAVTPGNRIDKDKITGLLLGKFLAVPLFNKEGTEVLLEVGEKITADIVEQILYDKLPYVHVIETEKYNDEILLTKSIVKDKENSVLTCIENIMSIIRPSEIINPKTIEEEFQSLFFSEEYYNLSEVGRFNINEKFSYDPPLKTTALVMEDFIRTIDRLIKIYIQEEEADDIDHLSNRRIRCVGELITNELKTAFAKMERIIKERFTIQELTSLTPQSLISVKPISSALNEFFGTSQLSQFMDQTNPLAELTHKRRLNALGPGGLTRGRAGYEVRDVHYTHYGRMCPIETPEGPNIGLIVSLAIMSKLNKYGFIITPYKKVENGRVTNRIEYLTAAEEENKIVAQASAPLKDDGTFKEKVVSVRYKNNFQFIQAKNVDYMDVSPLQVFSISAALIPFLEHDDANRALMGSNMQRQAVPLLKTEAAVVQTGMETVAARNSGSVVFSKRDGEVIDVEADKIVIKPNDRNNKNDLDIYELEKFQRTNQNTCYNQKPIVSIGDSVKAGDVIADGPGIANGELALGKNILVAFMPWEGYNYEDAILVSQKLLRHDSFTSIHIEEFEVMARDTKLGKEIITRDIANLSEAALKDIGEDGIIRIGAEVKPGSILVGKVTPKGESELTPEYKLLHSIFGEKARDVRDTSLRLPHGVEGTVMDIKVFSREKGDDLEPGIETLVKVYIASKKKLQVGDKLSGRHGNKGVLARILPEQDMPYLPDGTPVEMVLNPLGVPSRMNIGQILETQLAWVGKVMGSQFITPIFEGPKPEEIERLIKEAGLPSFSKTVMFDGRTGEKFLNPITVGYMYMLKLGHLVDDKIHARSTGPYSLVTQQPLGGKAQFGGQRFGEMEVWALEAYGASNTLQELLTVKSDDMMGRARVYESIIKGKNASSPGIPESFNVLIQELRGLCLDITAYNNRSQQINLYEGSSTSWIKLKGPSFDDRIRRNS
ncbi:MAG: DNA-directed RNA polymerase subunit beta [bacterium]|nr:DNA-directed RNA polymerase subunit beta [bacterium]